jgi:hypothetical protein
LSVSALAVIATRTNAKIEMARIMTPPSLAKAGVRTRRPILSRRIRALEQGPFVTDLCGQIYRRRHKNTYS